MNNLYQTPIKAIYSLVSRPGQDGNDTVMPDKLLQQFIQNYESSDKSLCLEEYILTQFSKYASSHPEIFGTNWRFVNMDFKYNKMQSVHPLLHLRQTLLKYSSRDVKI